MGCCPGRIGSDYLDNRAPLMTDGDSFFTAQCRQAACRFRFPVTQEEMEGLVCPSCGGNLEFASRPALSGTLNRLVGGAHQRARPLRIAGVLDNIRSIHNVGSMFRTADGARIEHLYLVGMTASPEHPRLAKAALGAERSVPWSHHRNGVELVQRLADARYTIIALETVPPGENVLSLPSSLSLPPTEPVALVVGNEKAGIDPEILSRCHSFLSLPMAGRKSSLNVAVAFGIAAYHLQYVHRGVRDQA